MRHAGRTVALGTRHGKERAFAPPLLRRLGLSVTLADIDTDQLGTFSGEVERQGTPATRSSPRPGWRLRRRACPWVWRARAASARTRPCPGWPWGMSWPASWTWRRD
ncbi:hypothetical protein [Aerophototrophica crusticola]|uniref:hypothetical protein n=1 Tax=Aerophototrophica crusticola TaxID=1709002 RepID=UPI00384B1072